MMKRRFFVAVAVLTAVLGFAGIGGAVFAQAQTTATGKFTAEQYKKALWMVTRFYGAQRSGEGPNWLLMDHTYKVSFVKDADGSRNLAGGWFDCGDHVTFGQTFFYSAYMLAKAYESFPTGFHDLYHGKDYSDYAASGKWSIDDGSPNGTPDLLEELKYATDWIIKATPDGSTFYYEKGDGNLDHKQWVTAGKMSTLPRSEGGEAEGTRAIAKNPNDGPMASFAAGALAVMSKIYRKYDAAYADTCLNHAKNAYTYANGKKGVSAGAASGSYYGAHKDPQTVFVLAASEMFRATGEDTYKNAIDKSQVKTSYHVLDYANSHDMVAYAAAAATIDTVQKNAYLKLALDEFVTKYTSSGNINGEKVTTLGGGWGQLRYAGNTAFSVALYSLAKNVAQYDQFIYDQIDYILGNNNAKQSFIVGFCEGCTKSPKFPHHRNVYLRDDNPTDAGKANMTIPDRNKSFGYLVGGTRNSSSFTESVTDYELTEGGIDYNAGLLGALAYIVSKLAPADTSKFGKPPIVQTPTTIKISFSANPSDTASFIKDSILLTNLYNGDSGKQLYAHVFDQNDSIISNVVCGTVTWDFTSKNTLAPIPITPHAQSALSDTGCSFTVPDGLNGSLDAVITSVKATYVYAGADRPSISKSFAVYSPPISVLPRTVSLAKHGYAMTVKPHAVTFTAAEGREITALSIYNIQGKRIFAAAGKHTSITWNRSNRPHGMYMIKLTLNNGAIIQRNLILK
jgi:endoglucanase